MAYTLAYLSSPVPEIPDLDGVGNHKRPPDSREHFGTEDAAMRRARQMLPASEWLELRLYGPDGRLLANQTVIAERLGLDNPNAPAAFVVDDEENSP